MVREDDPPPAAVLDDADDLKCRQVAEAAPDRVLAHPALRGEVGVRGIAPRLAPSDVEQDQEDERPRALEPRSSLDRLLPGAAFGAVELVRVARPGARGQTTIRTPQLDRWGRK
jgi:hypothetical protein